ncbi:hypothetical protein JL722_11249 [Aureococcus anophagefferens]|nr:hypothetical protein JL722_11249 [Aureococcus anophagefferens]
MARLLNKMMDVQRTLEAEIDASMGLNLTTTPSPDDAPVAAPPTADAPPGEPNGAGHDDALRRALAGKEAEREELLAEGTELAAKLGAAERRNKALKADRDDKADAVARLEAALAKNESGDGGAAALRCADLEGRSRASSAASASLQAERRPEKVVAARRRATTPRGAGARSRRASARRRRSRATSRAPARTGELGPSARLPLWERAEAAPAPDGGDVAAAHAEALEAAEAQARARVDDAERSATRKSPRGAADRERRDLLRDDADRAAAAAAAAPEVDADDLAARLHKTELERDAMERSLREAVADAAKAKRALRAPAAAAPDAAQHAAWRAEQRGRAAETDELRARLEAADSERRVLQVKLARALDDAGDAKDALHGATAAQAREALQLRREFLDHWLALDALVCCVDGKHVRLQSHGATQHGALSLGLHWDGICASIAEYQRLQLAHPELPDLPASTTLEDFKELILNGKLPVEQWRAVYSDLGIDLVQPQSLYELTAVLAGQEVVAAMRVGDKFVELIPKGKAPQARRRPGGAPLPRRGRHGPPRRGLRVRRARGPPGDGGGFDESLLTLDDALADTSLIFDGAVALGDDAALLLGLDEPGDSLFASTAAGVAALDPAPRARCSWRTATSRARYVPAADRQASDPEAYEKWRAPGQKARIRLARLKASDPEAYEKWRAHQAKKARIRLARLKASDPEGYEKWRAHKNELKYNRRHGGAAAAVRGQARAD